MATHPILRPSATYRPIGPYYRALLETAVFADFALPVSDAVDARVAANAGPGERQFQWGLAAGLRVHR